MKIISIVGVMILLGLPHISLASWISVPQMQPTIQAGIDAANTADTVVVDIGTYSGDGNRGLDFHGKNIVLKPLHGPGTVTIDCGGTAQSPQIAFNFHSGEDNSSIVRDIIIRNAYAGLESDSGAITCRGASPQFINCIVTENHANGARVIYDAAPLFINCRFTYNAGHGVYVCHFYSPNSDLSITGSVIYRNEGSGIFVHEPRNVYIANCTVACNGGHGIFVEGMPPKQKDATLGQKRVENTLSAYNRGYGMGSTFGFWGSVVVCSDAYGNVGGNFHSFTVDPAGISIDPLFCDTTTDYLAVAENSFCLAANNYICHQTIGAFDSAGCPGVLLCGDIDGDNRVTVGDIVYLINYVFKDGPPPNTMSMADVNNDSRVNIGDIIALINCAFRGQPLNCPGTRHDPASKG
jgi:hypothetical protein